MQNKTIDGVLRADLQAAYDELTDWKSPVAQKLRALLDAPAKCEMCDGSGHLGMGLCECFDKPAAQPQGEPVAWMYEHDGLVHNEQFKPLFYVNRQVGVQEPWNETPLYAHQPAPVAGNPHG